MTIKVNNISTDKIINRNVIKKLHYSFFIKIFIIYSFFFKLNVYIYKGWQCGIFWKKFFLTNFNINLFNVILFLLILMTIILISLISNTINYNTDYFFSLTNILLMIIFILFVSTTYTFIFILELISLIIFYKFITSRYWYKTIETNINNKNIPKNYLNMLFFQYWATFFSSILLFFALAQLMFIYGCSDFFFINFINYSINNLYSYMWLPLIIGFFFKIGFTPIHLFKLEVYKGLPLISLMVYTTIFFLIYFTFYMILLNYLVPTIKIYLNTYIYILIIIGLLYIISLLFDINLLKTFFAYSTIINSLLFVCAVILI